jgi:hypothetical protein
MGAALLLIMLPVRAQDLKHFTLEPQRLFPHLPTKGVNRVVQRQGYVVLEVDNHRVIFVNSSMQIERQIGKIGQGAGEFHYPDELAVGANGYIYVRDGMNRRYQIFDWNGKPVGGFPEYPAAHGLAVTSKGDILLGQPQKGKLVAVYNRDGKLLRSFGELHKLSDFYGPGLADADNQYRYAVNRIILCVDKHDNVYVGFLGAPVFQKYDSAGRSLFEKKITGPQADEIIAGFQKQRKSPVRRGIEGDLPTPLIITGMDVDYATGYIYISFQWDRAWIYVANAKGEGLAILEPPQRDLLIQNIELSEDGVSLLAARLSAVKRDEAYMLKIPPIIRRINHKEKEVNQR